MLNLDEVKEFLRIDHDAEDGYISILILLSKELCENYMRCDIPQNPSESIRQAQFLVISHFYENRTGEPIPDTVYRLLDSHRKEIF